MVLEYGCFVLVAILSAKHPCMDTVTDLPMPPVVLNMSGGKEASLNYNIINNINLLLRLCVGTHYYIYLIIG